MDDGDIPNFVHMDTTICLFLCVVVVVYINLLEGILFCFALGFPLSLIIGMDEYVMRSSMFFLVNY